MANRSNSIIFLSMLCLWILSLQNSIAIPSASPTTNWGKSNEEKTEEDISRIWNFQNFDLEKFQPPAQALSFNPAKKEESWSWETKFGSDDEHVAFSSTIVQIVVYIVIALVILSFMAFLLCICCPICVLAKMRHRRHGHVYARHVQGNIGQNTTITTTNQRPPVIAFQNHRSNAPYPVQESVTVIPLVNPQQLPPYAFAAQIPHHPPPNYIQSEGLKSNAPGPTELPPPYSGPLRPSTMNTDPNQLPYNPYFGGESQGNILPPPTK